MEARGDTGPNSEALSSWYPEAQPQRHSWLSAWENAKALESESCSTSLSRSSSTVMWEQWLLSHKVVVKIKPVCRCKAGAVAGLQEGLRQ